MSNNNFDADHLDTLDRDLGRLTNLEAATAYASRPMVGLGISFVFVVLASVLATVFFGQSNNTLIVIIAAGVGAYMALNIGANDVANNMGPAVGANALSMGAAIVIAAVFESMGALLAGGDVVSTIAKGIIAPEACKPRASLSGQCWRHFCLLPFGLTWPLGLAHRFLPRTLSWVALWGRVLLLQVLQP